MSAVQPDSAVRDGEVADVDESTQSDLKAPLPRVLLPLVVGAADRVEDESDESEPHPEEVDEGEEDVGGEKREGRSAGGAVRIEVPALPLRMYQKAERDRCQEADGVAEEKPAEHDLLLHPPPFPKRIRLSDPVSIASSYASLRHSEAFGFGRRERDRKRGEPASELLVCDLCRAANDCVNCESAHL